MQDQLETNAKLYIVVRADLPTGLQAAQAAHAAFQFFHEHPVIVGRWFVLSNYLVIVEVPDEAALFELTLKAGTISIVREPDVDNEITALALAPTPAARKLCGSLPLALGGVRAGVT